MKYLSVCSGIEAATVAWHQLGWTPVGFSEIEKFPSNVLQHHYPDVPNYGDMTDHERWERPIIDVLVGGTPCQSFSVAGLRKGMADPRGNLALIYLAIAEQYRPRWLVWENVPGVLSSDGGRDFCSIIGGMVELGYSPCWRVLDAQYFGVPQRRRRVFVVASLRDWRDSAEVLFEPESLLRNPAPSRGAGQEVTPTIRSGAPNGGPGHGARSGDSKDELIVPVLAKAVRTMSGGVSREDSHTLIPEVANPLTHRMHKGINTTCGEGQTPIPVAFNLRGREEGSVPEPTELASVRAASGGSTNTHVAFHSEATQGDLEALGENVSPTCRATAPPAVAFAQNQRDEGRLMDKAGALAAEPGTNQQTYIAEPVAFTASDMSNKAGALAAEPGTKQQTYIAFNDDQSEKTRSMGESEHATPTLRAGGSVSVAGNMAVRRLTPMECERLQGFPDGYTDIPGASDSARYKALGNSMAVPVMHWIGKRIQEVENEKS